MQIKKKINAFTLSEMIVVLIISSIVIGIAFSVLNLVQKHMSNIRANFEERSQLNALEEVLLLDFNKFPEIEFDSKLGKLQFKSPIDSLSYYFEDNQIIRIQDTFKLGTIEKQLYNCGNTINSGHVDAIKLSLIKSNNKRSRFIFKSNSASNLLRHGI